MRDNVIRFIYEIKKELEIEAPIYIEERVNEKSTNNLEKTNEMKNSLLLIQKTVKSKKKREV